MSLLKQLLVLCAVALVCVLLVVTGIIDPFGDDENATDIVDAGAVEAAPVVVQPARFASDAAIVEAVGTGDAIAAVDLFPEASGRVVEILFEAGERVEKGAPLIRLDAEEEQLAVDLARVQVEDARQQLSRYERAAPSGAVSGSAVDTARTALSSARIQLAQAELALHRRVLRAPFSGVIGISEVDVGDRIGESTLVATLDDRSIILVDFEVPESFAYGVAIGGEVNATTWAIPGERFKGTIATVGSRIDPQTRTLRVRARLPNASDQLRTGMSFTIRLPLQGERFPSVPSIAVQWDREGPYLWRVLDGKADRVSVKVLKRENDWILVDAPLDAGDLIVVEGVQRLRQGRAVDIVETADTPDSGGTNGV